MQSIHETLALKSVGPGMILSLPALAYSWPGAMELQSKFGQALIPNQEMFQVNHHTGNCNTRDIIWVTKHTSSISHDVALETS